MKYLQRKLYFILLLVCVMIFNFCSQKKHNNMVIEVDIKNPAKVNEVFSDYFFIQLEMDSLHPISNIEKMKMDDNYIYLSDDSKSIYIYDKKGKFVNVISRVGRSKSEYISIDDFDVYKSNIYVLSKSEKKVNVYDTKGLFIKTIKLDMWYEALSVYDDEKLLLFSAYFNSKQYNYVLHDYVNKIDIKKFDYFEENTTTIGGKTGYFNSLDDGTLLATKEFDMSIYAFSEKEMRPIYTLNFNTDESIPASLLEKPNDELSNSMKHIMESINYIGETKNKVYIESDLRLHQNGYYAAMLTIIDKSNNTAQAYDYERKYDYELDKKLPIVGQTLLIDDGYLIRKCSVLTAKYLKKHASLNIFDNIELDDYDNPFLFFYKLR